MANEADSDDQIETFERVERKVEQLQQNLCDLQTDMIELKIAYETNMKTIDHFRNESIDHQSRIQHLELENKRLERENKNYTNLAFTRPRSSQDFKSDDLSKEQLKCKFFLDSCVVIF